MSLVTPVALSLATIFGALAALHVYWAASGATGGAAVPARSDGAPLFQPRRSVTLLVAGALVAAALVVLGRAGLARIPVPFMLYWIAAWGLGTVLVLRAVGDFRYVGMFKRERHGRFARLDTVVYSPLCAALAAGVFYLAAQ